MGGALGNTVKTPFSRIFLIKNTAGPANEPIYLGQARITSTSQDLGDRTPIREPDPSRYGAFRTIGATKADRGLPTFSMEHRYQYTLSEMLAISRTGCPVDLHVHIGDCQDPRDFNGGWTKKRVYENVDFSSIGTGELGAFEQGQDAVINETVDANALDQFEVGHLTFSEIAGSQVVQEIVGIVICDAITCGSCGIPSDGCQTFFGVTRSAGASPGLPAEVIYSQDAGVTLGETNISSIGADEDPSNLDCVGTRLAVVSNADCALHYATIANILDGAETWTRNARGLVCPAGAPNAIKSFGSSHTFIVGDGGYIYFFSDITGTGDVQHDGSLTSEDLNALHGIDERNVIAVGDSNAILLTSNGGLTWTLVTGPAPGVNLTAVWMRSKEEWFVGTANGNLYYTRNAGTTWTQKDFPGDGVGQIDDIQFATPSTGILSHRTATTGRLLRTTDGGFSWYALPEGVGTIPTADYYASVAVCGEDVNRVYAGGSKGSSTDGILVKGSSA